LEESVRVLPSGARIFGPNAVVMNFDLAKRFGRHEAWEKDPVITFGAEGIT
jgi:hypothetical protein